MKTKLESSSGMTVGIDLGDKKHAICALNYDGEIINSLLPQYTLFIPSRKITQQVKLSLPR